MARSGFADSVFINCPFDREYVPLFEALVFCITDCGFIPRCTLEEPDSGEVRIRRIHGLIKSSKYAVHDLSRVELTSDLPRFNMPFELGLDLGCRAFGQGTLKRKRSLILDSDRYRYQRFLSDIAGQDIRHHANSPDLLITQVRNWLRGASTRDSTSVISEYCDRTGLDRSDIHFADYVTMVEEWLRSAG